MPVLNNGVFAFTIDSKDLSRGLRPTRRSPRNTKFLTKCEWAIGIDDVLQTLNDLTNYVIDTDEIIDDFPFPQLFIFTNMILVCSKDTIYQLISGSLVDQVTVTPGGKWSMVDFHDFIYASNGVVSVVRNPNSKEWESSQLPIASCICNLNGQVIIGAPNIEFT